MRLLLALSLLPCGAAAQSLDAAALSAAFDGAALEQEGTLTVVRPPRARPTLPHSPPVYTSSSLDLMNIMDASVQQAVGAQTPRRHLQAEVFGGVSLTQAAFVRRAVLPYGARVRVSPYVRAGRPRWFAEAERSENYYVADPWGHMTDLSRYGFGRESADGKFAWSVGYGRETHHPWENEEHPPEKGHGVKLAFTTQW